MNHLVVINFIICLGITFISLCRLKTDACTQSKLIRLRYVLFVGGSLASGLQTVFWGTEPSKGTVYFSLAVLVTMLVDVIRFRFMKRTENETCPMY